MRITRSWRMRLGVVSSRIATTMFVGCLVLATLIGGAVFMYPSQSIHAATPPDSCFATTGVASRTITDYYDNEGNNIANPACPRNVDIPSTIAGGTVVAMGSNAFNNNAITSITIPSTVITIGFGAFQNNDITSVVIPSGVTTISDSAFRSNEITTVSIPDTVTSLGTHAFATNQIANLIIPASLTSISNNAFQGNSLTSLTIPSNITSIGSFAFTANDLTTLTIPSTLTTIGSNAFSNNQLTNLTLQEGVTSIGFYAFENNQLTTLTLPASLTTLNSGALWHNYLETVFIPPSFTDLDYQTLAYQHPDMDMDTFYDGIYSGVPADAKEALDALIYVNVYVIGGGNPQSFKNRVNIEYIETNGDASWDDLTNMGGYIINPARITLNYLNQQNQALQQSMTLTGDVVGEGMLKNYLVTQGPVFALPASSASPTLAEQQAIDEGLDDYYRIGQTISLTPPEIPGYITPAPVNGYVLGASTNTLNLVYGATAGLPSPTQLANTGADLALLITAGLTMAGFGIASLVRLKLA